MINRLPKNRAFHASASIAGMVYVAGGQDDKKGFMKTVLRYYPHPKTPCWVECAPLLRPRYAFGLVAADKKLFAIGGFTDQGDRKIVEEKPDSGVESYDPGSNMWEQGPALPTPVSGVATVALGAYVYAISDGSASRYSVKSKKWEAIAPPSDKTRHLGLAAANGAVYAFGGWSMGAAMGEGATTDRVERYDPATNVWTSCAPLPEARHSMACAAVGSVIYCCGGTNFNQAAVKSCVAFDTVTNSWGDPMSDMIRSRGGAAAVGLAVNNMHHNHY